MTNAELLKSKIYEKLDYQPEPPHYKGKVPWKVQQQIAATNGYHYENLIGELGEYPIPDIPIERASEQKLLLDIGCGWGRWLVSSALKNYIPIGIDLRLEFCETARQVLQDHGLKGYTAVADLKHLPFKENVFDVVWSFSVIQHTHKLRLLSCISHIHRILKSKGYCFLEFPNKGGIRNRFGPVKEEHKTKDDYNAWSVRYYSIKEYRKFFYDTFKNFYFRNHSFLGIGILPNDLQFAKGLKNRLGIGTSLLLSKIAEIIKPLTYFSDSVYIKCNKQTGKANQTILDEFMGLHAKDPSNNLNIICLLQCPISGGDLQWDQANNRLVSLSANVYYPIINDVPILIASEAIGL
ncbi:MAG: methyltransferase domain-containing protein [Bacteroidota bacterium]|nr:methyltransferase domain-containing protein [Flavisolibacter sp.]MDQ3842699.1 methyltransferase domain-containing protein [Bacteroidota bacterium]